MIDGYPLGELRSRLPVLDSWTYMNTGTVGIMPDPVLNAQLEYIRLYEQGGHVAQAEAVELTERARRTLATLVGGDPDDFALNRNATDGINFVAAGFPLAPGDEVITSTEEHPAMVIPWLAACDRAGARLRFVDIAPDEDNFLDRLGRAITAHTRLVAMSQVSCETGTRIPVQAIRRLVGPDVAILVDASQSVGQFPVDIPSFGADFVIGNGHKWLAGPKGTGFAWFAPESLHLAPPVHFASDTVDPHWSRAHYQQDPAPGVKIAQRAARFEFGTRAWHLYPALHDAIEYQTSIGWDQIEAHMANMSTALKAQLAEIPGVTVHTPPRWEDSSGLVTFAIHGWSGVDASRKLWEDYRIAQRRVEEPSAVRVSCAYFTSEGDLNRLLDAVSEIAR